MKNSEIIEIFYEMSEIFAMKGDQWRSRAYRQAAQAIENLNEDLVKIYKKGGIKALEDIPGVGEGLANKIIQFITKKRIEEYEKIKRTIPGHILVLNKIPGMGPKKIQKLNQRLKITTLSQLEKAASQHKIAGLPGFGKKSEEDILEGIALMKKSKGKIPLRQAEKVAKDIISKLKSLSAVKQISVAGSTRRKKPLIRDVDILVASDNPEKVINVFTSLPKIQKVLAKGTTKATIIFKSGIQSDLRVLKSESWGAGLLYFTGSKNYNIDLRRIAIRKSYKLSEYGLFDKQTGKSIAGRTENEIFKKLGVKPLKPEQRDV